MNAYSNILQITTAIDALSELKSLVREARHHRRWTLKDLATRSGIPESTISRLERTGLASTDVVFKLLFAMNELDLLVDSIKESRRINSLPTSLDDLPDQPREIKRIRHSKEDK